MEGNQVMSVENFEDHARILRQMARHIELSMLRESRLAHGNPTPISTKDEELVATLLNSVYGHPYGKNYAMKLVAGLRPGELRSSKLFELLSVTVESSRFDHTITFEFNALPNKELQTAHLFKEAAAFSKRRAESHIRMLVHPSRAIAQRER